MTIGVLHGVLGIRWFDCTVHGMEAHAGPTPMGLRRDALQVATQLMQAVVATALRHGPDGRGTVGMVQVHPNSRNVIPGRVKFSVDLRNRSDELVDQQGAEVRARSEQLQAQTGMAITLDAVFRYPAQLFHAGCVQAVARTAERLGQPHAHHFRPGHGAVYVAQLVPVDMVFIPCKDGISHNEIEDAKPSTSRPAATCCCR